MDKEPGKGPDVETEKDVSNMPAKGEDKQENGVETSPAPKENEKKDDDSTDEIIEEGDVSGVSSSPGLGKDVDKLDYGMSLLQDSIYFDNEIQVRPELIESLTTGFTEKFVPSLERNRKTVNQIKSSQAVLIETVQQENAKFEECQANQGLETTMTKAKLYHAKLLRLRKDMTALYEKSAKLKRRAVRLQQNKQKEEINRAQQMEAEYEKEKMLTARVAPSSPEKET